VLQLLVPKIIGLLWERGCSQRLSRLEGARAFEEAVDVNAYWLSEAEVYMVSVYTPDKVLSLHLSTVHKSPVGYPYLLGRCDVLSWKRGTWEDALFNASVAPRTIEQLAATGLIPSISTRARN
jgi:hypothetical protein